MTVDYRTEWKSVGETGMMNRLVLDTNDEGEICDFANAMVQVLTKVCDKDEDELEQEWFDYSCGGMGGQPSASGCCEFFDKYADEVLDSLWAIDQDAYDIFKYVESKVEKKPHYGSGDDSFASALFPTD